MSDRPQKSAKPLSRWRPSRLRDGALTLLGGGLSRTRLPLWYAETIVLSARYQQWLAASVWASESARCQDRVALWKTIAAPRLRDSSSVVLEFGVAGGVATEWWSQSGVTFAGWHGFDTFEGLPADWTRAGVPVMSSGVFRPSTGKGAVPKPAAPFPYVWHKGLIEETLPPFERPDAPLFVLVDVDLLEPAEVILGWLGRHGRSGDLVYLDEAFDPWNEGLALRNAIADGLQVRGLAHTGSALLLELS